MRVFLIYIILLSFIGGFLRFYNLNWGSPFYFHPDERNIASFISSLSFHSDINFFTKGTFAYGSFISYVVFFLLSLVKIFSPHLTDVFSQSIVLLRIISSISSFLSVILLIYIGYKFWNIKVSLLVGFLSTFSTGLIQSSHFGTFESFITLMYILIFWLTLIFIKTNRIIYFFISYIVIGIASAAKINSLILSVIPFFLLMIHPKRKENNTLKTFIYGIIAIVIVISLTILFSPYYITSDFRNLFTYERNLLIGILPVFYTGEFFNSIPVLFQFTKIYPFLINPLMTIIFIPSLIYLTIIAFKKNNKFHLLLIACFLLLFTLQALFFAKWTRYMVPTLPFIYLILAIFLERFINKKILNFIIFISVVFTSSYFINTFVKEDTRIQASLWAKENIPTNSKILSEVYDMGIVPFNPYLRRITLFNFYDLDQAQDKSLELKNVLSENEYIILPSQRLLKTRLINKSKFPIGNKFYKDLLGGKLGYKKIYETPCDIFCKITYLGDPAFSFEETANVFDRPTVFIFKK